MPKNMLLRCFILCCSLSLLTACSNRPIRPSVQLYKPDFSKVKNTFNRYTAKIPRMSLRTPKLRKPKLRKKHPAALPLRRVASKKANTCPTPALRQSKIQTNRALTNRVQTKQVTQPRVATVAATRQTPQYSSRIRTVAHTQPVQTASKPASRPINTSQANAALFEAAKAGNTQRVSALLNQGANVNASNANGETALHAAASRDQVAVAQLLIQRGANINSQTTQGWTPLHSAARFGKTAVTQLLVNRNAQNLRNNQGKTAIQLAQQTKQHATVQILKAGRR